MLCINRASAATCTYAQFQNAAGSCVDCRKTYPGCRSCDINGCLSWVEGMFNVADSYLCVESWDIAIIPSTDTDQSPYFTDSYSRKCQRWGQECTNWLDDVGCTDVLRDTAETDASSYLNTIINSKKQAVKCSTQFADCELCTSSEWTYCSAKMLSGGSCTDAWTDSNCRYWNADKDVCTHCKAGYLLSSGSCVMETCTVSNCIDCTSPGGSDCNAWNEGYFLDTGPACTSCPSNWLKWGGVSSCDVCSSGYILSQDGTSCISECDSTQFIQVTRLATPVGSVLEKKQCVNWDTTCEECINGNGGNQCTKWALGKYLSVVDTSTLQGTCETKAAYSSNDDIYVYVSSTDLGSPCKYININFRFGNSCESRARSNGCYIKSKGICCPVQHKVRWLIFSSPHSDVQVKCTSYNVGANTTC